MIKLSIIIPVYKVEKYIGQCLGSILDDDTAQLPIEVIVVNDGTPDKSMDVVNTYRKYKCLSIINQKNQGLSMARNTGLTKAKGKYIWFIDSDDWVLPTALDDIFLAIKKHPDMDVFSSYMREYYELSNKYKDVQSRFYGCFFSGKEYMVYCPKGASQRFVYKRSFIENNGLRFYPGVLHEDGIWGNMMLYLARKVYILERPIYVYRLRNEGSIMSSIKVKSAEDLIKGHKVLVDFMYKNVTKEDYSFFRCQILEMIICSFVFCRELLQSVEYKKFVLKNKGYIRKEIFKVCIKKPYWLPELLLCGTPYYFVKYNDAKHNIKAFIIKLVNKIKLHDF